MGVKLKNACNFETVQFNNDAILGVSVFVTCEEPEFDRCYLETAMKDVGYDPEYIPVDRKTTKLKKATKKATNSRIRSVKTDKGDVYFQLDEDLVEDTKDGYKRKEVVPTMFLKQEKGGEFTCSNLSLKPEIEAKIPEVENEITTANLTKTMVKILEREFIDSVPIKGTYWFLPSRPGIQSAVDKLNLFRSKLQDCVTLITVPVLDNAENRASFWELICKEINERVDSITKKTTEMELETSRQKIQSLWTTIVNEKIILQGYIDLFQGQADNLEKKLGDVQISVEKKFGVKTTVVDGFKKFEGLITDEEPGDKNGNKARKSASQNSGNGQKNAAGSAKGGDKAIQTTTVDGGSGTPQPPKASTVASPAPKAEAARKSEVVHKGKPEAPKQTSEDQELDDLLASLED